MRNNSVRVLSIDPTTKGFGFVVLDGPDRLIDWGSAFVRGDKHQGSLRRVTKMLDYHSPEVLVLEDEEGDGSRRCARVRKLLRATRTLAAKRKIAVGAIAPAAVKKMFAEVGATNKDHIAAEVAVRYPELAPWLPPPRRIYDAEHHRMGMFDAAAFGMTFFGQLGQSERPSTPKSPDFRTPAERGVEAFRARERTTTTC